MGKTDIDWCDETFNIASGCVNGCKYCYARKIVQRFKNIYPFGFEPTVHLDRKFKSPKKPSIIFLDSMFDIFGDCEYKCYNRENKEIIVRDMKYTPELLFIKLLADTCVSHFSDRHKYLLLSKNPIPEYAKRMKKSNLFYGFSLTKETANKLTTEQLVEYDFFSCEPFDYEAIIENISIFKTAKWIILGCQTKPEIIPEKHFIEVIIEKCRHLHIPVFVKEPMASMLNIHIQGYPDFLKFKGE